MKHCYFETKKAKEDEQFELEEGEEETKRLLYSSKPETASSAAQLRLVWFPTTMSCDDEKKGEL